MIVRRKEVARDCILSHSAPGEIANRQNGKHRLVRAIDPVPLYEIMIWKYLSKRDLAFKLWVVFLAVACVVVTLELLAARFCAFANFKDGTSGDYARYTNMIWNCGHGKPFLYRMDQSYLAVHLSFTLALLAPLFWIVDNPFALAFLQWALLVMGGGILILTARRFKMPWHFILAVVFFWVSYHFSQSVVLCEFHGVCTYFVLIPFLYYCLVWKKNWVWIPFCLILGLREEAGLMILPLLLYFAVKERWRAGYVYAGAAVVYALAACFVLYPLINGNSLLVARSHEITPPAFGTQGSQSLWMSRLFSFIVISLPALPFLWRGWKPLVVIPSIPVLVTLASSYSWQVNLRIHYPAVIMASLAVAMIEAAREMTAADQRIGAFLIRKAIPIYLVALSVLSFYYLGFLWGCRENNVTVVYRQIVTDGLQALSVARHHVPKEGALFTEGQLAGFVGNRALMGMLSEIPSDSHYPDATVFCRKKMIPDICTRGLENGEWGVRYFDDGYVVLQRGCKSDLTRGYLTDMRLPIVRFTSTLHHASVNEEYVENAGTFRCWKGSAMKWPAVVAYGESVKLAAGRYVARFAYKAQAGKKGGTDQRDIGAFLLFLKNTETRLAEAPIGMRAPDKLTEQDVAFEVHKETEVEPRVYGGGASLWLLNVKFLAVPAEDDSR